VRVNYLYYWSEAFRDPRVEETQVPVRYDPFDLGTAFAYVQGRWVRCRSEYYLQLRGHSERELQIASAEMHKRYQNHAGEAAITAKRLATLLADSLAHEEVLMQRLQDLEARDVFAQMGGYRLREEQDEDSLSPPSVPFSQDSPNESSVRASDEQEIDDEDEDLEHLEEYGEYE
jgi:putative transposase